MKKDDYWWRAQGVAYDWATEIRNERDLLTQGLSWRAKLVRSWEIHPDDKPAASRLAA